MWSCLKNWSEVKPSYGHVGFTSSFRHMLWLQGDILIIAGNMFSIYQHVFYFFCLLAARCLSSKSCPTAPWVAKGTAVNSAKMRLIAPKIAQYFAQNTNHWGKNEVNYGEDFLKYATKNTIHWNKGPRALLQLSHICLITKYLTLRVNLDFISHPLSLYFGIYWKETKKDWQWQIS